ncbi:hypothetical protein MMC25_006742 [Agyrium rufum]|nr:hypothetical protein [Agyrium rufum]
MSDLLNANPTIRNASDLPTRRRQDSDKPTKQKSNIGLFTSTIPSSNASDDPFFSTNYSSSEPESDTDSADNDAPEPIDEQEIYDLVSTISDPEHPLSLGSLGVINLRDIQITTLNPRLNLQTVLVEITPTITHCSLATAIGLGVRVRLEQSLPPRFRVDVRVKEGTHSTGDQVNKQLGDKERVAAALENETLMGVVRKMLETCQ